MNVAEASVGSYFLIGSGDGFIYEKFGDNGTPEHPRPVVYKYNWNRALIDRFEIDSSIEVYPVTVVVEDPSLATVVVKVLPDGRFFLRDTEPAFYYQVFHLADPPAVGALKLDRATGQYLDFVLIPEEESVRTLFVRFILAAKEY